MSQKLTPSILVDSQVPEFLVNDAQKFLDFMKAYYDFMETYTIDIEKLRDVDDTPDEFVTYLLREFAARFPRSRVSDRNLIRYIKEIYRLKGTEDAIRLMFRLFFDLEITIVQPNKNILRASDGRWRQSSNITVRTVFGTIDFSQPIVFTLNTDSGTFRIETESFFVIDEETTTFSFTPQQQIPFAAEQTVDLYNEQGQITYRGVIIGSPNRIRIVNPGKFWKRGQVVIIPGEVEDTVARVVSVGPQGEMLSIEIVRYGAGHTENQTVIISPFPVKPASSDFELETTIVGLDGSNNPIFDYVLTLNDTVDGISETIIGTSTASGSTSYFLETYAAEDYSGSTVLAQNLETGGSSSSGELVATTVTLEQWVESRATLLYEYAFVVRSRGFYTGDEGQISNQNIRLQDSYYYQLFSYVIQTTVRIEEYRNLLNLIHPAGLKFFGELSKQASIDLSSTIGVSRYIDGVPEVGGEGVFIEGAWSDGGSWSDTETW